MRLCRKSSALLGFAAQCIPFYAQADSNVASLVSAVNKNRSAIAICMGVQLPSVSYNNYMHATSTDKVAFYKALLKYNNISQLSTCLSFAGMNLGVDENGKLVDITSQVASAFVDIRAACTGRLSPEELILTQDEITVICR